MYLILVNWSNWVKYVILRKPYWYLSILISTAYIKTAWMKVFKIIPEFRILRLTFHRKSAAKS